MGEPVVPENIDMRNRPFDWNTEEKRERFRSRVFALHVDAGMPLRKFPTIGHKELDVYGLFMFVDDLGGFKAVATNKLFRQVGGLLELPRTVTNAGYVLRGKYEQILKPHEKVLRAEFYPDSPYYRAHPDERPTVHLPDPGAGQDQLYYQPSAPLCITHTGMPSTGPGPLGGTSFGVPQGGPGMVAPGAPQWGFTDPGAMPPWMTPGAMNAPPAAMAQTPALQPLPQTEAQPQPQVQPQPQPQPQPQLQPPAQPQAQPQPQPAVQSPISMPFGSIGMPASGMGSAPSTVAPGPAVPLPAPVTAEPDMVSSAAAAFESATIATINANPGAAQVIAAEALPGTGVSGGFLAPPFAHVPGPAHLGTTNELVRRGPVGGMDGALAAIPWGTISVQVMSTLIVAAVTAAGEEPAITGADAYIRESLSGNTPTSGFETPNRRAAAAAAATAASTDSGKAPCTHPAPGVGSSREAAASSAELRAALDSVLRTGLTAAAAHVGWVAAPYVRKLVRTLPTLALPLVGAAWPYAHLPLPCICGLDDRVLSAMRLPRSVAALSIIAPPPAVSGTAWPLAPTLEALSLSNWPVGSLTEAGLLAICEAYPRLQSLELSGLARGALTGLARVVVRFSESLAEVGGDANRVEGPRPLSMLRHLVVHDLPAEDSAAIGALAVHVGRGMTLVDIGATKESTAGPAAEAGEQAPVGLRSLAVSGAHGAGGASRGALFGPGTRELLRTAASVEIIGEHAGGARTQPAALCGACPNLERAIFTGVSGVDLSGLARAAPNLRRLSMVETRIAGTVAGENLGSAGPSGLTRMFPRLSELLMRQCAGSIAPGLPDGRHLSLEFSGGIQGPPVPAPAFDGTNCDDWAMLD